MVDKKTLVLAVAISWALTLVTVLLISNFAPSLTQPFTQQFTESNSVKVVNFQKQLIQNVSETNNVALYFNFTWAPSNPNKNAILAIIFSFEYSCDDPPPTIWENENVIDWHFTSGIRINTYSFWINSKSLYKGARNLLEWNQQWSSEWETATFQTTRNSENEKQLNQNQNYYPIELFFAHTGVVPTYIRNVNLTLLVIDG